MVFFGLLPRLRHVVVHASNSTGTHGSDPPPDKCGSSTASGIRQLTEAVLPWLCKSVVVPTVTSQGFASVRLYGHTWAHSPECRDQLTDELHAALHNTFQRVHGVHLLRSNIVATPLPTRSTTNLTEATFQLLAKMNYLHAFLSIKHALALLPRRDTALPVLLLRWDAVFFTDFQLGRLDWSLFYKANWCTTELTADPAGCRRLQSPHIHRCPAADSPDFWFAANSSSMNLVFRDALDDLVMGRYRGVACGVDKVRLRSDLR